MPNIALPSLEIIYKDLFVLQPLYRMTRQWFMENEYRDAKDDPALESAMEVLYWYRDGTHVDQHEREVRIWWRTIKKGVPFGTAGSPFYKHHVDIDWNVINMVDREIMRGEKKQKVQFGELRIVIRPFLEVADVSKTFLIKYFDYWFRTRLIKKNLEENRKMLYQDAYRLQGTIKRYLELKSFLPEEETFHEKFEFI